MQIIKKYNNIKSIPSKNVFKNISQNNNNHINYIVNKLGDSINAFEKR